MPPSSASSPSSGATATPSATRCVGCCSRPCGARPFGRSAWTASCTSTRPSPGWSRTCTTPSIAPCRWTSCGWIRSTIPCGAPTSPSRRRASGSAPTTTGSRSRSRPTGPFLPKTPWRTPRRRRGDDPAARGARPLDRRRGTLGSLGQFAQELQHPDPGRLGAVSRGRPAEGEERRREGAGRDRRAVAPRGAQLRDEVRGDRRRAEGGRRGRGAAGAGERGRRGVMRHRAKGRQLSRTASHKKALLANLATSLFRHDRIVTTEAKAKELRPYAERLITLARRGDLHARRLVERRLKDRDVTHKLFKDVGPRFASRPGGYTRIIKLGHRGGDGAEVARIELLGA